ncbi:NAD-dependent epimerase [bacterium DOLZORAL124_38_8]|nr:MAG: NAD-dependent epimerase [bacterium DOLZORAL124_38_8]
MSNKKILITGANGQLGQVLAAELRKKYGEEAVLVTDVRKLEPQTGNFEYLDILDTHRFYEIVQDYKITEIYNLAAILSASGEANPARTWNINLDGMLNVFDIAKTCKVEKIFHPSSIAVFGDSTPKENTPQFTSLEPSTVYGISKVTGELWSKYYFDRYRLDIRALRYPGVIGYQSLPGGGTTDYAVEIFHEALKHGSYECFLQKDTRLPMIYMDDVMKATLDIMEAPKEKIKQRTAYNLAAISFTPEEIANEIKKHIPDFKITYKPDYRQAIAESWTESIDDSHARNDWGWKPEFDLAKMVEDMIRNLKK